MEDWKMWALWAALGFNLAAGVWSLAAAIRYTRKETRLDRGETSGARELEEVRMSGPCLPPPPNPRPNPPDSGLNDEQWAQFLAKQKAETVQIEPAKTYKECFFNRGVFMALEAAFRSRGALCSRDSREYAEIVRAFWHLAPHFGDFWPGDGGESSDG